MKQNSEFFFSPQFLSFLLANSATSYGRRSLKRASSETHEAGQVYPFKLLLMLLPRAV